MANSYACPARKRRSRCAHARPVRLSPPRPSHSCGQRYSRYSARPYCRCLPAAWASGCGLRSGNRRRLLACRAEESPETACPVQGRAVVKCADACRHMCESERLCCRAHLDLERCGHGGRLLWPAGHGRAADRTGRRVNKPSSRPNSLGVRPTSAYCLSARHYPTVGRSTASPPLSPSIAAAIRLPTALLAAFTGSSAKCA